MSEEQQPYTGGTALFTGRVKSLPANPDAISTVEDMRLSEVQGIHKRLGRICAAKREGRFLHRTWKRVEWDRFFGGLAVLFLGAAVGSAIAFIPLFNVENDSGERSISNRALIEYGSAVGVCVVVGILALIARMAIKAEREDSVMGIYSDLGDIVGRYESPTDMPESVPGRAES
jgi:hypothetical protein